MELSKAPSTWSGELQVVNTQSLGKGECMSEKREGLRNGQGIWGWAPEDGRRETEMEVRWECHISAAKGGGV